MHRFPQKLGLFVLYGCLTVVLRWSYDSILIIQMLKFKQNKEIYE